MRRRSLRVRLTLWHAGLLGVTLIVLSLLTLVLMRRVLSSRLDDGLADYADKTARSIADILYRGLVERRTEPEKLLTAAGNVQKPWDFQAQVVDGATGLVRDTTQGLAGYRLMTTMDERVNGQKGQVTFDTRYLGQDPVRVVTVPVQMGRRVPYLVQAVVSLGGIEEALQRTGLILLVLAPSMFLLSLCGGWLLVGRSLRPVDAMTRTAMAMDPARLDHRIEPLGSDDEIAHLASAFNEMMGRLDRSFRQVQQFSADASHELKTPLTSIRGQAEVALMGDLTSEEHRAVLRSIVDDTGRMSAIVEDLLLLARADADQVAMRREPVAIHELALETYEKLEPMARRKGVELNLGDVDEAEAEIDRFWTGQILTNLLNNAVKYTPTGGSVTLSLAHSDARSSNGAHPGGHTAEFVRVTVADNGPGIPAEHLPRIFDRFYRVDAGRSRDAGGVGLGLNIAQWAAHAQGGRIEVQSEVGKGSSFTLILPTAK